MPENEFIEQAKEAQSLIKDLALGHKIKNRIISNISNSMSSSPKNALYKLASKGLIEKKLVDSWVSLRNKSAHADKLNQDLEAIQYYIDELYKCQNLFNILLLLKIGFTGSYQDLSKDGWEESNMSLKLEQTDR